MLDREICCQKTFIFLFFFFLFSIFGKSTDGKKKEEKEKKKLKCIKFSVLNPKSSSSSLSPGFCSAGFLRLA